MAGGVSSGGGGVAAARGRRRDKDGTASGKGAQRKGNATGCGQVALWSGMRTAATRGREGSQDRCRCGGVRQECERRGGRGGRWRNGDVGGDGDGDGDGNGQGPGAESGRADRAVEQISRADNGNAAGQCKTLDFYAQEASYLLAQPSKVHFSASSLYAPTSICSLHGSHTNTCTPRANKRQRSTLLFN